jgi:L-iditol 2-dehydrogenase
MVKGTYRFPLIPGHEFAGEVAEVGREAEGVKVGDSAAVIPLIPCKKCLYCRIGEYALCDDYDYLGSRTDGAFAEYVVAPAENLILLPEGVSFEMGALTEPGAVALHAIRQGGGIEAGSKVAVFGAGTIGLLVAQWAKILGAARVFVVDVVEKKLEVASELGFSDLINASETDPVDEIINGTGGLGVDLSVEAAGSKVALEGCIRAVRKLGRVVLAGNIETEVVLPQKTVSTILRHQLTLSGTWNSLFTSFPVDEWRTVLHFMQTGALKVGALITHRCTLEKAPDVFEMMYNRREFFNKVVFTP